MNYTERIVTQESLKDDVLCYWQMTADIEDAAGIHTRHLPKGQNLLVFNYGDDIEYLDAPKLKSSNPPFIVVPAIATSRIINQKGRI